MSGMKDFRPRCSGCVFQQGLVPLDSGFQETPMWLVSYQVSRDYHATAIVLLLKSSGCPQKMPEKSKKGSKATSSQLPRPAVTMHVPAPGVSCPPHAALPQESSAVPYVGSYSCLIASVHYGSPQKTPVLRGWYVWRCHPALVRVPSCSHVSMCVWGWRVPELVDLR